MRPQRCLHGKAQVRRYVRWGGLLCLPQAFFVQKVVALPQLLSNLGLKLGRQIADWLRVQFGGQLADERCGHPVASLAIELVEPLVGEQLLFELVGKLAPLAQKHPNNLPVARGQVGRAAIAELHQPLPPEMMGYRFAHRFRQLAQGAALNQAQALGAIGE